MAKRKQTYKVTGSQPVEVKGSRHNPGETFEAHSGDVAFLVEVGAVKSAPEKK